MFFRFFLGFNIKKLEIAWKHDYTKCTHALYDITRVNLGSRR